MKKYISGLSAIVLAICFSAFSTSPAPDHSTAGAKKAPSLFWYAINPDGSLGSALNNGAQMDKSTALGYTPCQDVTAVECDRGYSSRQVVGANPAPATNSSSDYHIKKTQ